MKRLIEANWVPGERERRGGTARTSLFDYSIHFGHLLPIRMTGTETKSQIIGGAEVIRTLPNPS